MSDGKLEILNSLWDYTKPAESEARFRELLPEATGRDHAEARVEILTQIARAQGLQQQFDDAHATLDEAEALLTEGMSVGRTRIALERGRAHNSSGNAAGSRAFFEQALDLATESGAEYYAVDAAHMLGIVSDGTDQLTWNLRAMDMAEAASDPRARRWLGALYNNIGWTYHDLEDYETALEKLGKALDWYQENGNDRQIRIGRWSVAKILRLLGRIDEALEDLRAVEKEWKAAGQEDGYVYEELAECLLTLGQDEQARSYFARAHEVLSKDPWLAANEPARLIRLEELGRVKH